jgi:FAD-linked oxidoreductase
VSVTWKNWAKNQVAHPIAISSPRTADEVSSIIRRAAEQGQRVKSVGSGHSFTSTAVTDGQMLTLKHFTGIVSVDRDRLEVTVGAGTALSDLNTMLDSLGLALPNLGDIAYQTVAGAISTSTHGTGITLTGLAGQVAGFTLVDGLGNVLRCSESENAELFALGRVSVGALGVITEYRLRVVPAFRLRAVESAAPLNSVLDDIDTRVNDNDHFEFFWIPHTKWALTKTNNRTEDPLDPLPRVKGWIDKTFMENVAFGAVCRLGKMRPQWIPRLATALPSSGARQYVDQSYKIFASPRLVRFYEMENAIPREAVAPALREIRSMIEKKNYLINFPVEVRFTAPDDIALSTAYHRPSAYIAVHMYRGMEYENYFRDVENILKNYDARPHWGKLHFLEQERLQTLYPKFNDFLELRHRLDPQRVFSNSYTQQIFGD